MQHNERDEDDTRKKVLEHRFVAVVAKLTAHTHAQTDTSTLAHTQTDTRTLAHTQAHTIASTTQTTHTIVPTPTTTTHTTHTTPAYTAAVTLQQVEEIVRPLREENKSLKKEVAELSKRCDELASQLRQLLAAPRISDDNIRRGWHEQANSRIGAKNSRAKPERSYGCAHEGCDWRNKKVTLQAYVLHLKRKHGENISDNPDLNLLPMLSR